jgi:hypothetical protein
MANTCYTCCRPLQSGEGTWFRRLGIRVCTDDACLAAVRAAVGTSNNFNGRSAALKRLRGALYPSPHASHSEPQQP